MSHAADGSGSIPAGKAMKAVAFTSAELVKEPDAELIASAMDGKGKMPASSGRLSAARINDVVSYMRTPQK
jgi:cytochrome c6